MSPPYCRWCCCLQLRLKHVERERERERAGSSHCVYCMRVIDAGSAPSQASRRQDTDARHTPHCSSSSSSDFLHNYNPSRLLPVLRALIHRPAFLDLPASIRWREGCLAFFPIHPTQRTERRVESWIGQGERWTTRTWTTMHFSRWHLMREWTMEACDGREGERGCRAVEW